MDKQLWRKVEQLASTVDDLRSDGDHLSGWPTGAVRVFLPLLVEGRDFARMPVTHAYIESEVARRGLFSPAGTMPLDVIDISELEMLLAIKEFKGQTLPTLVHQWVSPVRVVAGRWVRMSSEKGTTMMAEKGTTCGAMLVPFSSIVPCEGCRGGISEQARKNEALRAFLRPAAEAA